MRARKTGETKERTSRKNSRMSEIGMGHVTVFLEQRRFDVRPVGVAPDSTDIEATSRTQKLLVHVKTALHPAAPVNAVAAEIQRLSSKARRSGREIWQADVTVDEAGHLTRNIHWTRLT